MRSEKARDVEMTLAKHSHMVRSKSLKCLKSREMEAGETMSRLYKSIT